MSVTSLGTVVGVWPHPDDESYVSGGLMALAAAAGQRVVCVTATHGSGPRATELDEALAVLGVSDHVSLDYTDGGCDAVDPAEGTARVSEVIRSVRPDTVLTFGPDGFTGHPDHIAVSRWTTAAVAVAAPSARLLYPATTSEHHAAFADVNLGFDVFFAGGPTLVAASDMALNLTLDGETLDRKVRALEAHASQTAGLLAAIGRERYASWVTVEAFVDAARVLS